MRRFYPYIFVTDLRATLRPLDPNKHPPSQALPEKHQGTLTRTCTYLAHKYPVPTASNSAILFEVKELDEWYRLMKAILSVMKHHFEDRFDDLRNKHRDVVEDILAVAWLMEYSRESTTLASPFVLPSLGMYSGYSYSPMFRH